MPCGCAAVRLKRKDGTLVLELRACCVTAVLQAVKTRPALQAVIKIMQSCHCSSMSMDTFEIRCGRLHRYSDNSNSRTAAAQFTIFFQGSASGVMGSGFRVPATQLPACFWGCCARAWSAPLPLATRAVPHCRAAPGRRSLKTRPLLPLKAPRGPFQVDGTCAMAAAPHPAAAHKTKLCFIDSKHAHAGVVWLHGKCAKQQKQLHRAANGCLCMRASMRLFLQTKKPCHVPWKTPKHLLLSIRTLFSCHSFKSEVPIQSISQRRR